MKKITLKTIGKSPWLPVAALAGVAGLGYLAYRYLQDVAPTLSADVGAKLPLAKDLDTIPDDVGNYDIDGVSFDTEGVIISSDAVKTIIVPI